MNIRYTVYVPLINQSENVGNHDMLEIYSDIDQISDNQYRYGQDIYNLAKLARGELKEIFDRLTNEIKNTNRNVEPVVGRLKSGALRISAHAALEAVRKINLKKPNFALYQWLKPQSWLERQRLSAVNSNSFSEGGSATLGMALLLLSNAAGIRATQFIATGDLRAQGSKPHDVEVLSVAGIEEKLKFILQQRQQGDLPDRHLPCFTPRRYFYYNSEGVKQEGEVLDLPEITLLKDQNIEVVPVGWLSEAIIYLGITCTRRMAADSKFCFYLTAIMLGAMLLVGYEHWLWRPIPIEFVHGGKPLEYCSLSKTANIQDQKIPPFKHLVFDRVHKIPTQATMAWYVRLPKGFVTSEFHAISLYFGKISGMHPILPNKMNGMCQFNENGIYKCSTVIGEVEEESVLVVLVRRGTPFHQTSLIDDVDNFRDEFDKRFPLNAAGYDAEAASDYFLKKAPGHQKFSFVTDQKLTKCEVEE